MQLNAKNFQYFCDTVLSWYQKNGRKLPWRKKAITPYEVWVSEIMLQQTQVSRGILYYKEFLKKFPNIRTLAKSSWEDFLPSYEGLGYYRRGRNMLKTAKIIVQEYAGKFPKDKNMLVKLPGVGEYTANAILAFAYDEPVFSFDANLKRIFKRYFPNVTEEQLQRFLSHSSSISGREINSALMDFGSLLCVSRPNKLVHDCPFKKECQCFENVAAVSPKKRGNEEKFDHNVRIVVVLHEDHKKYFSEKKNFYRPFIMKKGIATRSAIKEYFLKKYKLKVSVRPPKTKKLINGIPSVVVNTQILSGKHTFHVHPKVHFKSAML